KAFKSDSQRMAFFILSLGFVFTVVWLVSWLRCSHLNAALAQGWHQRSKVSVFIGFFSSLYT
ncbi:hypothetical protein, partial [Vibrio parahaemolyticus]|uniref:hypothetical protein n=1 Tax=Vibrio parahaemolyticus TaxID=670 RepID=UPI0004A48A9C